MLFVIINALEFNLNANKPSVRINKHQLARRTKRGGEQQKKEGEEGLASVFSSAVLTLFKNRYSRQALEIPSLTESLLSILAESTE